MYIVKAGNSDRNDSSKKFFYFRFPPPHPPTHFPKLIKFEKRRKKYSTFDVKDLKVFFSFKKIKFEMPSTAPPPLPPEQNALCHDPHVFLC